MNKLLRLFYGLLLVCLPSVASAQYFEVGCIGYRVLSTTDHTAEVVPLSSGASYQGNINILATVTYDDMAYEVVSLGKLAFYGATLSSITIPSSVTQIKEECFLFATVPSSITIPASVAEIEYMALAAWGLTEIIVDEDNPHYRSIEGMLFSKDTSTVFACPTEKTGIVSLPQHTRHIAKAAFSYCLSLEGVTMPEGLLSMGEFSFVYNYQLNNLVIPASVSFIGSNLFAGCSELDSLSMAEGNAHYYMDGMAIYSAAGDTLVSCHKSADSLFLPNTLRVISGFNTNTDIEYVHVPEGVTTICDNAFGNSTLRSIELPSQMDLIDEWAFYRCDSLTHVAMPASLDSMGEGCFEYSSHLPSIALPNGIGTIPQEAFYACESLRQIAWGSNVTVIDTLAFGGCGLTEVVLPPTLQSVRKGAFKAYGSGELRRIVFTAPVDTIEPEAFTGQTLRVLRLENIIPPVTVTLPDSTGYGCLYMASVDSIIIPCASLSAYQEEGYWGQFAEKYHERCEGIDDAVDGDVSVYPNPAADWLMVRCTGDACRVELMNATGQVVLTMEATGSTTRIDVSHLSRGVYLLRLSNAKGKAVVIKN